MITSQQEKGRRGHKLRVDYTSNQYGYNNTYNTKTGEHIKRENVYL
jgi:hypothetical protein